MNTSGPIYGGDTDSCGTGPLDAPNNVNLDADGYEVIFRQPVNPYELRQVLKAAYDDPFSGYGADGDLCWSLASIRDWWAEPRRTLEEEVRRLRQESVQVRDPKYADYHAQSRLFRWGDSLEHDLYPSLQAYGFFLDSGRPAKPGETLPDLHCTLQIK